MNIVNPTASEILNLMMSLGEVKFLPTIREGYIMYSLIWDGVSFCPVEFIPGDEIITPTLDIDVPPMEGGFFPKGQLWSSPDKSIMDHWEIIKTSSIRRGGTAILYQNRCWVVSLAGEWIDVSMHVKPAKIKEGEVSIVNVANVEPIEWDDESTDQEFSSDNQQVSW